MVTVPTGSVGAREISSASRSAVSASKAGAHGLLVAALAAKGNSPPREGAVVGRARPVRARATGAGVVAGDRSIGRRTRRFVCRGVQAWCGHSWWGPQSGGRRSAATPGRPGLPRRIATTAGRWRSRRPGVLAASSAALRPGAQYRSSCATSGRCSAGVPDRRREAERTGDAGPPRRRWPVWQPGCPIRGRVVRQGGRQAFGRGQRVALTAADGGIEPPAGAMTVHCRKR